MTLGRVKVSDKKMTSGSTVWTSRINHSQNGNALVCGLSTRKIRTPLRDPEQHDVAQGFPKSLIVRRVKVGIDDVFVLFRWVFGILDRAVGSAPEPFRMLREPGMVGRALDGKVECDF